MLHQFQLQGLAVWLAVTFGRCLEVPTLLHIFRTESKQSPRTVLGLNLDSTWIFLAECLANFENPSPRTDLRRSEHIFYVIIISNIIYLINNNKNITQHLKLYIIESQTCNPVGM